jgi:8-oxo-dGTP pyrophosphatase MutT (NUDIX family)
VPPPQVIPRPADARPGRPSPWAALPAPRRTSLSLARVREALTTPVDSGAVRAGEPESAVLVALFDEAGETRVVLTRRAATLRRHRHEVSFPGGAVEPGEALVAAALREANEEVGLDPATVELIGTLDRLTTVSSRARITPFVGVLEQRPVLVGNPSEVERVFDVALTDLMAQGVHSSEHWGHHPGGPEVELHFFALPGDIVWGATARVLTDLLWRVTSAQG